MFPTECDDDPGRFEGEHLGRARTATRVHRIYWSISTQPDLVYERLFLDRQ